jgi:hypothetical protein
MLLWTVVVLFLVIGLATKEGTLAAQPMGWQPWL